MIARFNIKNTKNGFYCEEEHCENYIKRGEPHAVIVEVDEDNELISKQLCLGCSVEIMKNHMDEVAILIDKIKNI